VLIGWHFPPLHFGYCTYKTHVLGTVDEGKLVMVGESFRLSRARGAAFFLVGPGIIKNKSEIGLTIRKTDI
jgi:hypothetical protein